jgi:hypothetical protein
VNTTRSAIILVLLTCFGSVAAQGQTAVPHVFQTGAPARAADVNANFDVLEATADEHATAIANLETRVSANETSVVKFNETPRWRVLREDAATGGYLEVPDIAVVERLPPNTLSIVFVKLPNSFPGGLDWFPAVLGGPNILTFGYQGTPYNHTILAFQPNSNCSGPPVKMVVRSAVGPMTHHTRPPISRGYTAYDFRNGNIYYAGEGDVDDNSDVSYDLLEYGNEEGSYAGEGPNFGCTLNVNLSTRPDLSIGDFALPLPLVLFGNYPPEGASGFFVGFR